MTTKITLNNIADTAQATASATFVTGIQYSGIPAWSTAAIEAERQTIRDRYAAVQTTIDSAQDSDQLLTVLQTL